MPTASGKAYLSENRKYQPDRSLLGVGAGQGEDGGMRSPRQRRIAYVAVMGSCLVLIILAWTVVRLFSTTAAIVMSAVAAVLPPIAVMIGNDPRDPGD